MNIYCQDLSPSVHSPCVIILVRLYENASRLFKPYPGPCFFNFSQLIKKSTGNHECKHDYVSKRKAGTSSNSVMFVKVKKSTMKKTEVMSSCRMRTGVPCVQKPSRRRVRLKSCSATRVQEVNCQHAASCSSLFCHPPPCSFSH